LNKKIRREVTTISRLLHNHIVRYYAAWYESAAKAAPSGSILGSSLEDSALLSSADGTGTMQGRSGDESSEGGLAGCPTDA